jgi:hypothetical protein
MNVSKQLFMSCYCMIYHLLKADLNVFFHVTHLLSKVFMYAKYGSSPFNFERVKDQNGNIRREI